MNKNKKIRENKSAVKTLVKILICVLATAFTTMAAVFDTPLLCLPTVLLIAIAVLLDD